MRVAYAAVDYAMHESDDPAGRLFDADRGCTVFSQRVLRLTGASSDRVDPGSDEVLYVLEGTGTVTVDGARHALGPGNAVFVAAGQSWSVAGADELDDPLRAGARARACLEPVRCRRPRRVGAAERDRRQAVRPRCRPRERLLSR